MSFSNLFAINNNWIYPPDNYQEEPIPVVGYNLTGEPVRQGYPVITFSWTFMKQVNLTDLMKAYNPNNPRVKITYIDKYIGPNTLVKAWGMMHEPLIGARQIVFYNNVAVKFTRIIPATVWTTSTASIKASASTSSNTIATVTANTQLELADEPDGSGWLNVIYDGNSTRWIRDTEITYEAPSTILVSE